METEPAVRAAGRAEGEALGRGPASLRSRVPGDQGQERGRFANSVPESFS